MEKFKILGQQRPAIATPTVLYKAPLPTLATAETAQTIVLMLACCNVHTSESVFKVHMLPDALAAATTANEIYHNIPLGVNETLLLAQGTVIPGDTGDGKSGGINVETISGDITYTLVGVEITR